VPPVVPPVPVPPVVPPVVPALPPVPLFTAPEPPELPGGVSSELQAATERANPRLAIERNPKLEVETSLIMIFPD
jgi:hypothetical protein